MDTDFLTRDAYRVLIGHSGEVSDFLRAEIGSASSSYSDEDSYLQAMHDLVSNIAKEPDDYLDYWNLIDDIIPEEFGTKLRALAEAIRTVIKTPLENRGSVEE